MGNRRVDARDCAQDPVTRQRPTLMTRKGGPIACIIRYRAVVAEAEVFIRAQRDGTIFGTGPVDSHPVPVIAGVSNARWGRNDGAVYVQHGLDDLHCIT